MVIKRQYQELADMDPHYLPHHSMRAEPCKPADLVTEGIHTFLENMGHFPQSRQHCPTKIQEVPVVQIR